MKLLSRINLITISLLTVYLNGQDCDTPTPSSLPNYSSSLPGKTPVVDICVDVEFHILRTTGGVNAFNPANVPDILDILNEGFNRHHIYFNSIGTNIITNNTYFDLDEIGGDNADTEFNALVDIDRNPNALNIYIVNLFEGSGGRADGIPSIANVVPATSALTSTIVHEVGHNFGLVHTHETAFGTENIERPIHPNANCSTAGDRFCDTPADPNLNPPGVDIWTDNACNYTGTFMRNGLTYDPDTSNYMSYSRRACRDSFSDQQAAAMYGILDDEPDLVALQGSSCTVPEINGVDLLCCCSNSTFTLIDGGSTVIWSASSNLSIISSSNNGITVKAVSGARGVGFVEAELSWETVRHEFWVGKPNPPSTLSGPSTVLTGALVNYSSSEAPGATSYLWWLPHPYDVVSQYNYNSPKWQRRNTTSRYLQAFTGTGGYSGLVQVMGVNACGTGGAKTKQVSHGSGGGGGIPLTFNISGFENSPDKDIIYPNPVDNTLYIHLADEDSKIGVISLSAPDGSVVYRSLDRHIEAIDTSLLPNGLYVLNIETTQGIVTKKVLIKH